MDKNVTCARTGLTLGFGIWISLLGTACNFGTADIGAVGDAERRLAEARSEDARSVDAIFSDGSARDGGVQDGTGAGPLGPMCAPRPTPTGGMATSVARCHENSLVDCAGRETSCGANLCREWYDSGSDRFYASCQPEGDVPCDPEFDPPVCDGSRLFTCEPTSQTSLSSGPRGIANTYDCAQRFGSNSTCVFEGGKPTCTFTACDSENECAIGSYCVAGQCVATPTCSPSEGDTEICDPTHRFRLRCDPAWSVFVAQRCDDCESDPVSKIVRCRE